MEWSLAHPLHDIDDMIELADSVYGSEVDGILKRDRNVFRHRLTVACTEQLLGFCWFDRGGYTTYSNEEISNAKFHHIDLSLPVRTRVRLLNEMIDQHILWSYKNGVSIICSTSIRADHDGFMKIHKKRGFVVNGSYAWIRTEEAIKCLTNQSENQL
jgi:hypothetical protein